MESLSLASPQEALQDVPGAAQEPAGLGQPRAPPSPAAAAAATASEALASRFADADLDAAAVLLDDHARALRADLLSRLLAGKAAAEERRRADLAAMAAAGAHDLSAKQQEVDATAAQLAHQREVARRTGDALFRAQRWRRHHTLACIAWRAWREQAARQRRIRAGLVAAQRHYTAGHLQGGAFRAWRAEAAGQLRLRVKAQAAATLDAERQRVLAEAGATIAQQAQRLEETEAALAAAQAARAALEGDVKRAFMRGVCALNSEAMALMRGAPAGQAGAEAAPAATAEQAATGGNSSLPEQQAPVGKLLLHTPAATGPAGGWAIGAVGLEAHGQPLATASPAMPPAQQLAGMSAPPPSSSSRAGLVRPMPAAELLHPATVEPRQRVPTLPPPPEHHRRVERGGAGPTRPATAASVPCSLPSNVVVSRPVARPATSPARRAQPAAAHQQQQQQQQVSRRSLAGQQRSQGTAGGQQVLVVRGGRTAVGPGQQGRN